MFTFQFILNTECTKISPFRTTFELKRKLAVMEMEAVLPEDYLKLRKVGNVKSNGKLVLWSEVNPDSHEKSYASVLKALNIESGEIKAFSAAIKQSYNPQFSSDGKLLYFISTRIGKPQVFVMDLEFGGEAIQVTKEKNGITAYSISPDGEKIAFTSKMDEFELNKGEEDKNKNLSKFEIDQKKAEEEERERLKYDPLVIDDLVYREGTSYHDKRKSHLFIQNLNAKAKSYRLSKRHTNHLGVKWISNNSLLTAAKLNSPTDLNREVSLLSFTTEEVEQDGKFIYKFEGWFSGGFEVSPNGTYAAFVGLHEGNPSGQNGDLMVLNLNSAEMKVVNQRFDRGVSAFEFISDDELLFLLDEDGINSIRKYYVASDNVELIGNVGKYLTSICQVGEDFYCTATEPLHPNAVWKIHELQPALVDDPNTEYLNSHKIIEPEEMWFDSPNGFRFQGWYFDAGLQDGNKPALTLSIHGGPHVMWNNAGSMWHEWQSFLSQGYSVLACNPQGSQGYGEKFAQTITSKWGVDDARDLLLAVDQIVERVDPEQLYILGGSYAGFQTANMISRDHRFKAAVAQRGVYDMISFGLTMDIPLFSIAEWEGTPWDKLNHLWEHSPVGRAKEIQTPLMIIAGENDFRVPISQSEELFAALKLDNKDAVLVRYPRDGHELSRSGEPLHVVDRIDRMINWFEKYRHFK